MTREEIVARIALLKAAVSGVTCDSESGHTQEDSLREDFLEALAEQCPNAEWREMARLVLSTREIEFSRWHS